MSRHHYSAGGVVVGPEGLIAVVSQNGDSWSLPKGHLDEGESAKTAARREIEEETGIDELNFIEELGNYERPTIGRGGIGEDPTDLKTITLFLCTTPQRELKPIDPANPEARWVKPEKVTDYLTHAKDKEFYLSVLPRIKEFIKNVS